VLAVCWKGTLCWHFVCVLGYHQRALCFCGARPPWRKSMVRPGRSTPAKHLSTVTTPSGVSSTPMRRLITWMLCDARVTGESHRSQRWSCVMSGTTPDDEVEYDVESMSEDQRENPPRYALKRPAMTLSLPGEGQPAPTFRRQISLDVNYPAFAIAVQLPFAMPPSALRV